MGPYTKAVPTGQTVAALLAAWARGGGPVRPIRRHRGPGLSRRGERRRETREALRAVRAAEIEKERAGEPFRDMRFENRAARERFALAALASAAGPL